MICAAVGLAGDHGDLCDGGLAVGVEQLGAAPDDPVVILIGSGQDFEDRVAAFCAGEDRRSSTIAVKVRRSDRCLALQTSSRRGESDGSLPVGYE